MKFSTYRNAAHLSVMMPETYIGGFVRIHTEGVHVGYARLIREKENIELQLSDLHVLADGEERHGPAVLTNNKNSILVNRFSLSGTAADVAMFETIKIENYDEVYAVHSPYWPEQASEWITRRRLHGFPSKSVIKQCCRYGCDFVQISHKSCSTDNDWRFSFSYAELLLTKSWTIYHRG